MVALDYISPASLLRDPSCHCYITASFIDPQTARSMAIHDGTALDMPGSKDQKTDVAFVEYADSPTDSPQVEKAIGELALGIDPLKEKALVSKIDRHVIPMVMVSRVISWRDMLQLADESMSF